ncbi:MAG TPA: hypothetical protein VNM69_02270 [Bacillus sp. (in: firmicutes)]|nr:hypothetical protein [Bacillus sp. (in: firmicutes)]
MREIEEKICSICGQEGGNSVDHIPPKNLFLEHHRHGRNLITVPAHTSCNNACSRDDDYFRIFILIYSYWKSTLARELWDTKVRRQLSRKESEKFKGYLQRNMVPTNFHLNGALLNAMKFNAERIDRVASRIAKGLYYHKTGFILDKDLPFDVSFNGYNITTELDHLFIFEPVIEGIFKYAWIEANEQKEGIIRMIFFDTVEFYATYG